MKRYVGFRKSAEYEEPKGGRCWVRIFKDYDWAGRMQIVPSLRRDHLTHLDWGVKNNSENIGPRDGIASGSLNLAVSLLADIAPMRIVQPISYTFMDEIISNFPRELRNVPEHVAAFLEETFEEQRRVQEQLTQETKNLSSTNPEQFSIDFLVEQGQIAEWVFSEDELVEWIKHHVDPSWLETLPRLS